MSVASSPIDLVRYPLDQPGTDAYQQLVATAAASYRNDGVALLPGFVTNEGLAAMTAEADQLVGKAFFCRSKHDAYLNTEPTNEHGIVGQLMATNVGSIANDYLDPGGAVQLLYDSDWLTRFIADVVGATTLFTSDDPLGAVSINVFGTGDEHSWHFDESLFSVTLMVQEAEQGGFFEYVTGLRGPDFDDRAGIEQVVLGDESQVQRLPFTAGTLSIFQGRHTLHRVTQVGGARPRLVPVLTFAPEPGYRNSDAVRELFWGRAS